MVNGYGYKVCFRSLGKSKMKIYAITNTYDLWYQREPPEDRETKLPILNVKWFVVPITTNKEYRRLWRDCPFDP